MHAKLLGHLFQLGPITLSTIKRTDMAEPATTATAAETRPGQPGAPEASALSNQGAEAQDSFQAEKSPEIVVPEIKDSGQHGVGSPQNVATSKLMTKALGLYHAKKYTKARSILSRILTRARSAGDDLTCAYACVMRLPLCWNQQKEPEYTA